MHIFKTQFVMDKINLKNGRILLYDGSTLLHSMSMENSIQYIGGKMIISNEVNDQDGGLLKVPLSSIITWQVNDVDITTPESTEDKLNKVLDEVDKHTPSSAKTLHNEYVISLANGESLVSEIYDVRGVDKIQFSGKSSSTGMTMRIESRANENQAWLTTDTIYDDGIFFLYNIICRQSEMRISWINNTGSTVLGASMEIKVTYGSSDKLSVFPVGVQPSVFSQAALVQAILRGKDPDDVFREVKVTPAGELVTANNFIETLRGNIDGVNDYGKFGQNDDIDIGTDESIWKGGGEYTGFNPTSGEAIGISSTSSQDAGTLVTSGTVTGGSATTMEDSSATFITNGVAVGDCIIIDTQNIHGIVKTVTSETELEVWRFADGAESETDLIPVAPDTYRIASPNGTGCFVQKVMKCIESDWAEWLEEYVILNGTTEVDTVGTDYIRNSTSECIAFGSSGTAQGDITGRQTTTTANIFWFIPAGANRTQVACDSIPGNKWLYITTVNSQMARANGAAGSANFILSTRKIGQGFATRINAQISDSLGYDTPPGKVISIPPYTDIKCDGKSISDNNTAITAEFNGVTIDL